MTVVNSLARCLTRYTCSQQYTAHSCGCTPHHMTHPQLPTCMITFIVQPYSPQKHFKSKIPSRHPSKGTVWSG